MVRRYMSIAVALICSFAPLAAETDDEAMGRLVDAFFTWYAHGETDSVASLFHFPPSQSTRAADKDIRFIVAGMRGFLRELGSTGKREEVTYQESSYDFRVNAGSEEYWAEHYKFESKTYRTTFSKADRGYILFDFCKIGTEWEIAFVRFALPASNPEAEKKFTTLGTLIPKLMESATPETEADN